MPSSRCSAEAVRKAAVLCFAENLQWPGLAWLLEMQKKMLKWLWLVARAGERFYSPALGLSPLVLKLWTCWRTRTRGLVFSCWGCRSLARLQLPTLWIGACALRKENLLCCAACFRQSSAASPLLFALAQLRFAMCVRLKWGSGCWSLSGVGRGGRGERADRLSQNHTERSGLEGTSVGQL